jgi:hypothetical protein
VVTFLLVLVGLVIVTAIGVGIRRRGNAGDPAFHGPEPTGYENGAAQPFGDNGAGGV